MCVVGAGGEVVGPGVGRGEDEAAVVPRAVVVVEGVGEQVAVAVVDAVQVGGPPGRRSGPCAGRTGLSCNVARR